MSAGIAAAARRLSVSLLIGCFAGGAPAADPNPARWTPRPADTWHLQLTGRLDTTLPVRIYVVDLFETEVATIHDLQRRGRKVVCYFSAGSFEPWRPDLATLKQSDLGKALEGWPRERWLDTRSDTVRAVMRKRLELAQRKGCDGTDPDNVDAWSNDPGLPLDASTQHDYAVFLAREAHRLGLAIGLRNNVEQAAALAEHYDFAINEQCREYSTATHDECAAYRSFTRSGKAVFHVEYEERWVRDAAQQRQLCVSTRAIGLNTLVLPPDLDGRFRHACLE